MLYLNEVLNKRNKMKKLLEFSEIIKHLPRTGWVNQGIAHPETVASHSWQMALMALALSGTINDEYDYNKVIKLCLCHDLAESVIGDITPHEDIYATKKEKELAAMAKIAEEADFPEAYWLFTEYEAAETPEAKLANDLDKLDMYAQALNYEKQYPETDLSEFKNSAATKIKTKLGKILLQDLIN